MRPDSYCHTYGFYKNEPAPSKSREVVRETLERAKQNAIDAGDVFPVQQLFLQLTSALYRIINSKDGDQVAGAQMQADLNLVAMVWQAEFTEWWEEFAGDVSHINPVTNPPERVAAPNLKVIVNEEVI